MMTRGGKSGSMAPVMMTGAGGESLEYKKNPATEPKWIGKTLYLKFWIDSSIWGIKVFEDTVKFGEIHVSNPVCKLDMHSDFALPVGMTLFKLNKKVYLVGGETTSLTDPVRTMSSMGGDASQFCQSSDKVYEFDPSDLPNSNCCFREIPDYRLHLPMQQPIVAKLRGKVYVLHGDPIYWGAGCPEKPELAFQVLEFGHLSKSYHWRTLPIPPFYDVDSPFFGEWRDNAGVLGTRLFMCQVCEERGEIVHIFDSVEETWESHNEYEWPLGYVPATNLSSSLITQRISKRGIDIVHESDRYFIAIGNECLLDSEDRVFATVIDYDGVMFDIQFLPDPLPAEFYPLAECIVIDLLDEDEQDKDGDTTITFCVLYVNHKRALLALSVFRVSLLSPMRVVKPRDGSPYLS